VADWLPVLQHQAAQPVCVGLEHTDCLLRQYKKFIIEIPEWFRSEEE
jgi:hypothetical protein